MFTILKIIGIVLLVLLAVVLVLAALICFVPVRYQAQVEVDKALNGRVTASYLLHLVHIAVRYNEKERYGKLRICGIPVFDLFPSEEKQKKKEERKRKKAAGKRKKSVRQKSKGKQNKAAGEKKPKPQPQGNAGAADVREGSGKAPEIGSQGTYSDDGGKTRGAAGLIKKVLLFLKNFIDKVRNFKYTIRRLYERLKGARETMLWYVEIWQREQTQRAFRKCTAQLKRMYRHLKPKRFEAAVEFGFDDPGRTGDVFGKLCMLYPFYAGRVILLPNFENNIFKGKVFVKGSLRLAPLISVGWKLMFDKDIRNLYNVVTGGWDHE